MSARIVVAEDEDDIRRLILFTLRRRGYTVLEAANGEEALEVIRRESPDLVVLDVVMPVLSGLEVMRQLAEAPESAHVPILLLSGRGQAHDIQTGFESGAVKYIVKPFSPQYLADAVGEILGERETAPVGSRSG